MKYPLQVASELELVLSLGFETVCFIDLEFTMLRKRTLELRILCKYGLRWCCQTRIDAVDAGLLRQMRISGCSLIHYGIESGLESTRQLVGKPTRTLESSGLSWRRDRQALRQPDSFCLDFPGDCI